LTAQVLEVFVSPAVLSVFDTEVGQPGPPQGLSTVYPSIRQC